MSDYDLQDEVRLQIPAQAEYIRIARLAIAGVASLMGVGVEAVEDLKVAVTEACSLYLATAPERGGMVSLRYLRSDGQLQVEISGKRPPSDTLAEQEMGLLLIQMLMDQVEEDPADNTGQHVLRMSKRLTAEANPAGVDA